ncbi:MAG TPA: YbaK/EbsC family protein [Roseiarcus sp.]|nr:YbaK/EbsC family protein [Roseiarcus sp.]
MKPAESASALKVQAVLGDRFEVLEFDASTRTAADAAAAIGCDVAQIAKSLIFRGGTSGRAVLIIASGVDRVDEKKAAAAVGEPIDRADADFVREATGFAIGGVPPVGHKNPPIVLIEQSVMQNLGGRRHAQRGLSTDAGGPRRTDWRARGRSRAQIEEWTWSQKEIPPEGSGSASAAGRTSHGAARSFPRACLRRENSNMRARN